MNSILDGSPAVMNDFRCQLDGLLATLQKLSHEEQQAAVELLQVSVHHQLEGRQAGTPHKLQASQRTSEQENSLIHEKARSGDASFHLQERNIVDKETQQEVTENGREATEASQQEAQQKETTSFSGSVTTHSEDEILPHQGKLSLDVLHPLSPTATSHFNFSVQKATDCQKVHDSQQLTGNTEIPVVDEFHEHTVHLGAADGFHHNSLKLKSLHSSHQTTELVVVTDLQQNESIFKTVRECKQHFIDERTVYGTHQSEVAVNTGEEQQHQQATQSNGKYDETSNLPDADGMRESTQQQSAVSLLSLDETQELTSVQSGELEETSHGTSDFGEFLRPHDEDTGMGTLQEPASPQITQEHESFINDRAHLKINVNEKDKTRLHPPNSDENCSSSFNVTNLENMDDRDHLLPEETSYLLPYLERENYEKSDIKSGNVSRKTNMYLSELRKFIEIPYSSDNFFHYSRDGKSVQNELVNEINPVDLSGVPPIHSSRRREGVKQEDVGREASHIGEPCQSEINTRSKTTKHNNIRKRKCQSRIQSKIQRKKKTKVNNDINMILEEVNFSVEEDASGEITSTGSDNTFEKDLSVKAFCDKLVEDTTSNIKHNTAHDILLIDQQATTLSTKNSHKESSDDISSLDVKDVSNGESEQVLEGESSECEESLTELCQERKDNNQTSLPPNLRPVSCRSCKKELADTSLLPVHFRQCEGHLTCTVCQAKFVHKVTFTRHMEGHKRNVCSKCSKSFCSQKKLKAHMKSEHNFDLVSKTYTCETCNRSFIKRSSLYYHLKVHAAENEHVCQTCGEFCKGIENYKIHMAEHVKAVNYHCHICTASFRRQQQYVDHLKHHKKNRCELCGQPFTTKRALIRHCRSEHKTLPKNVSLGREYKCDKCGRVFNRPSVLHHHLLLHGGVKPLECHLCNKRFSHKRGLRKHMNSLIHGDMLLTNNLQTDHAYDLKQNYAFMCEYCGIRLPTRLVLLKHSRLTHQVGISWNCPHCDYKTKRHQTLKRHMDLHLEKKNFMCEICGSSFHAMATLKDHHKFVHSDERNYKCSECDKTFKNQSSLARHRRTHSDDRPYQCHCGTSYKRLSHLKRHMSSAHNEVLKSRAVKKLKEVEAEDLEVSTEISCDGQNHAQTKEISDVEEFEFVPVPNSSFTPVIQAESSDKNTQDILLPTQESIILMGDNSSSEQGHLIVGDSQIIQLIPSTFQFPQDTNLQAVSLVSTGELHTLPVSSSSPYSHVAQSSQVVVEPFSLSQNSETMVMVPASQEDSIHLSDSSAIRTTLRTLESETLTDTNRINRTGMKREVKQEMSLHTLENHTELSVTPSLEAFDYSGPSSSQTLLPTLPPAHYITHTHNSGTQINQDLLQQNLICSEFVLPVDAGR